MFSMPSSAAPRGASGAERAGGAAGVAAGRFLGGTAGAAAGTAIAPGAGTVVGGVAGATAGAAAGGYAGSRLGGWLAACWINVLHPLGVARRTFNSIESTADQAEAFVQQGRWAEAERHYRELIGQTHVINYEYDDWLRRLGEILSPPRARARSGVRLPLSALLRHGARCSSLATSMSRLRARLAEIEKKWIEAAQLYQQAKLPVHAAVSFETAKQYPEATAAWKSLLHAPGLAHRAVRGGARPLRLRARGGATRCELGRGAPRADREPAQARAGRRRLRADRRARARVRLLPDPAQARQGDRRSSRTSPRATSTASACCATTTSSSTSCSTTRTSSSSRSSAASSTPPRRSIRRPRRSRRAPACRTTATTSTRAR